MNWLIADDAAITLLRWFLGATNLPQKSERCVPYGKTGGNPRSRSECPLPEHRKAI